MALNAASLGQKEPCFPDLRGQVALVTGGGTGIGRGIALRLAAEGMKVAICGRRAEPLASTVNAISARKGEALAVQADVSDAEPVESLFAQIAERWGPLNAMVHNAMRMEMVPFDDLTSELWEEEFATACRGAYLLARAAVPAMRERGRGGLVSVSSVGGLRAHLPGLPYDATKGALDALVRALAIELGPDGIRVNAIAPGATYTRKERMSAEELGHPNVPLRRYGTPAEMAAVVAFLLSQQSSYITGQVIYVDGGITSQISLPGVWL